MDSAQFFRASPGLLAASICIIDYGDSFRVGWPTPSSVGQGNRVSGFSPPENIRGLKAVQSSDLWALGCINFEICSGSFLFPTAIESPPLDTLWEIEHALGSLPSNLPSLKHDGDTYSECNARSKVSVELAKRIYQRISEIKVEPIANSEGIMTESREQQEDRNRYAQIRPFIKLDPTLFWKPEPAMTSSSVDRLIRTWDEILTEIEMWKWEKPSPKILSTEAENCLVY